MARISKQEVCSLLRGFVADGYPCKAVQTQAWLKSLWRWPLRQDLLETNVVEVMEVDVEKRSRERVYSDAELIAIWKATEKLSPIEDAYIKLMLLLAPRKIALALMKGSDLDGLDNPTLWIIPFELNKSKKTARQEARLPDPAAAACTTHYQRLAEEQRRSIPFARLDLPVCAP
jgi:hypothetical protein